MERIDSINPERIAWCCADRGVTPSDLAMELGIPAASMDRVMDGESGITFNQLRKIAEYLGRGVLFFLEPGPVDEAQIHTPQFRTLANQKPELSPSIKTLIERVEKQRAVYLSLREDLDETNHARFNPPELSNNNPRAAARIVRSWLGLGDKNGFDSYRAAVEAKGVLVFLSNGYNGKWQIAKESPILGFALYDADCPAVLIKKRAWDTQQTFTLIHELGHILLHKSSSIDDEQDFQSHQGQERDANAFAGHLLVPDAFLATIQDATRPEEVSQFDQWLSAPRKTWGASTEVILRRLLDAGRLSQSQYVAYRHWRRQLPTKTSDSGSREWRHREPKHIFGDTFVRTVLDSLNERQITLAKASSYLDSLKIKDLHQLQRHYAGL